MKILLKNARISFADGLFNAGTPKGVPNATPKFGSDFIIDPKTSVFKQVEGKWLATTMDKVILEMANDAWKGKGQAMLDSLNADKKCYRNGNARVDESGSIRSGYEGTMYVSAKNKVRPEVVDKDMSPLVQEDGKPYSGCRVNVSFDIYVLTDATKKGVHATLKAVQFAGDDESFGGGVTAGAAAASFEDISVEAEDLL